MSQRVEVTFDSGGQRCGAYLYLPELPTDATGTDLPCVVMAPGFNGTRDEALPPFADRFADAGLAVLLFDYRHFGVSEGEPRGLISARCQREDYRAAVRYARSLPGIDPDRIALWGTSFSGGHVITIAAGDPRIAAVVSQVPFLDGMAAVRTKRRKDLPARVILSLLLHRPARSARRLVMPWLVLVALQDRTTPPGPAVRAARRAPAGELIRYAVGHSDVYAGTAFESVVDDEVEFLTGHLFRA